MASEGRQRMRLRDFLQHHTNEGTGGLDWIDKENMILKIPWQHGGKQAWREEDAIIFKEWAKLKSNRRHENYGSSKHATIFKENFRNALKKGRNIRELTDQHDTESVTHPYRVYQLLSNSDTCTIKQEKSPSRLCQTADSKPPEQIPIPSMVEGRTCDSGNVPIGSSCQTFSDDLTKISRDGLLPLNDKITPAILNSGNLEAEVMHTTQSFEEMEAVLINENFRSRSPLPQAEDTTNTKRRQPFPAEKFEGNMLISQHTIEDPTGSSPEPPRDSIVPSAPVTMNDISDLSLALSECFPDDILAAATLEANITEMDNLDTPIIDLSNPFSPQSDQQLFTLAQQIPVGREELIQAETDDAGTESNLMNAVSPQIPLFSGHFMQLEVYYNAQHVQTWQVSVPGACCIFYNSMTKASKQHKLRSAADVAVAPLQLEPEWSQLLSFHHKSADLINGMEHGIVIEADYDGIYATRYCNSIPYFSNFFQPNDSEKIGKRNTTCIFNTKEQFQQALSKFRNEAKEPSASVHLGLGRKWNFGQEPRESENLIAVRLTNGHAAALLDQCKRSMADAGEGTTICISSLSDEMSGLALNLPQQPDIVQQ